MIPPVAGLVVQDFTPSHQAIDAACVLGSPVRAMTSGYGSFHWDHDMGWVFTQEGPQGTVSISHLAERGPNRYYGVGEIVSRCGSTGRLFAGPHVHVEGPPIIRSVFGL